MKGFLGVVTALSLVMFLFPTVSMAGQGGHGRDRGRGGAEQEREVRVSNYNSASIMNVVGSESNTGGNWAGGSEGGNGGDGGDVEAEGKDAEVEESGAGNGGNGGHSGLGGFVETGNATTNTAVMNMANSNDTRVSDDCGCEGRGDREVEVRVSNTNRAHVFNAVGSSANTGYNNADGSYAGNGGDGGEIEADGYWDAEVEESGAGHGGHGGNSGKGGTVYSGDAHTTTDVVTVVNRNVTRVR